MPSRYTGNFIFPPRATVALDHSLIVGFEAMGYGGQIKKNGTHTEAKVYPDRRIEAWDRHGELQKAWSFTPATAEIFQAIPGRDWFLFDMELVHNKTKHIKQQLYVYDILVCEGIHLTGTTYEQRYQLLFDVLAQGMTFPDLTPETQFFRLNDHVSIARNYPAGFGLTKLFLSLTAIEDEGLVLRDPKGVYTNPKADSWMVKFRRKELTKNYR